MPVVSRPANANANAHADVVGRDLAGVMNRNPTTIKPLRLIV